MPVKRGIEKTQQKDVTEAQITLRIRHRVLRLILPETNKLLRLKHTSLFNATRNKKNPLND